MGRKKSGLESVVGGLTTGAVIYGLWFLHFLSLSLATGIGVILVVFPILGGLRRIAGEVSDHRRQRREALEAQEAQVSERKESLEKTVFQVARERRGVVTPAQVVLTTDLQLDEAEKVLEGLAARGHAEMRIKENGTIDYVFAEFS